MPDALLEFVIALVAMFVGFQMGREWERVFPKPDCPFPGTCVTCNPLGSKSSWTVHYQYTQSPPPEIA